MSGNHLFSTLEKRLKGLLHMVVDDVFLDREHRCVRQVTLVVSLNPVTSGKRGRLPPTVEQTLDAAATLYTFAESLRGDKTQFSGFWMRVLSSKMMENTRETMRALTSFQSTLKSLHAIGFHVKLHWQNHPLTVSVLDAIRAFLHAPRAQYERCVTQGDATGSCRPRVEFRPLQVAIEFFNCHLNETLLTRLMETLQMGSGATLCERGVLRALRLAGTSLDTVELNALATLLEAPATRRIDSLGVINAMPVEETVITSEQYTAAFNRVLMAAFKSDIAAHKDHGFALSLAGNDGLRPSHIAALHEALAGVGVTRPLRALSLAGIQIDKHDMGVQIGKLVFDSSTLTGITTMDDKCELNLTASCHGDVCIRLGLTQLVKAATPQVQRALQDHVPVYCRVLPDWDMKDVISRTTLYKVVGVGTTADHSFSFSIEAPRAAIDAPTDSIDRVESAEPVVFQSFTAGKISCIRIGDTDIIRSRFTSFVRDTNHSCRDAPCLRLLGAMGVELKRLALRNYYNLSDLIGPVFEFCPRLEELNVKHSQIDKNSWRAVPGENWRSLQVLSVTENASCMFRESVSWLQFVLANVQADLALQHVSLNTHHKTQEDDQIRAVRKILRQHKSIEEITIGCTFLYFDAARDTWKNESSEHSVLQKQIDQQLRVESLSQESRLAFLSVLRKFSTPLQQNLDNGVVAEIFKFANAQNPRVVTWY